MTATLAAELDTRAAHMVKVRAEYEHTKADHARVDGCTRCGVGFVEGRSTDWDYDPDGTPDLCPPCVAERDRYAAQMTAAPRPRERCANDHDLTVAGNRFAYPDRPHLFGCLVCRGDRTRRRDQKRRAAKAAGR